MYKYDKSLWIEKAGDRMKAIVQDKYGTAKNLRIEEVPLPKPRTGEVLVRVKAVSLNAPDWRLLSGSPFIMRLGTGVMAPKDKVKGTDAAGVVEALGEGVTHFKVGDAVYCDASGSGFGTFAEYVCVKAAHLALKPATLSWLEAAALPLTAVTALQALRDKACLGHGETVLIVGASGGVGSYAIQLAKAMGACVTAVTSGKNADQAKALGADAVIDYTEVSLENIAATYDVVLAINGYYKIGVYKKLLSPKGRFVLIGGQSVGQLLWLAVFGRFISHKGGQSFQVLMAHPNTEDLEHIQMLADSGQIVPVIKQQVSFEEIPKWLETLSEGHVGGKVVASIGEEV